MSQPDVRRRMRIRHTDWGDAVRIDLNQLGSRLPAQGVQGATWSEEAGEALRDEWAESQNVALCDTLTEVAARLGGNFDSFAEWTVLHNRRYDGTHMRSERRARFGPGYRAAITTLGWAHPSANLSTCIQAVGYVPRGPRDVSADHVAAGIIVRYRVHGTRPRRCDPIRRRPADPSVGRCRMGRGH